MFELGLYKRNGCSEPITTFSHTWEDSGMCCGDFPVKERVSLGRVERILKIRYYNGCGSLLSETRIPVSEELSEEFFESLESIVWNEDYSIPVCDGWTWDMVLGKGKNDKFVVKGTVEAPEEARDIQKLIYKMIEGGFSVNNPHLWCFDIEEEGNE